MKRGRVFILCVVAVAFVTATSDAASRSLTRYGSMREALAMGKNQARVQLQDVVQEEHFYGVGALAGLRGEITVLDSKVFVTSAASQGALEAQDAATLAATLLIGQSVSRWSEHEVPFAETPKRLEDVVREAVLAQGIDLSATIAFVVEAELVDVRLHVIRGACPVHAARNGIVLAEDEAPYSREVPRLAATVVGIRAENSTGELTHPDTDVHAHALFVDPDTGQRLTAHLERARVAAGAVVKLPAE